MNRTNSIILASIAFVLLFGGYQLVSGIFFTSNTAPTPSPQEGTNNTAGNNNQNQMNQQNNAILQARKQYTKAPGLLPLADITDKKAVIKTTKGDIEFEIFPESPLTASNFAFLAKGGFYNGLTFHRVEPGFVIQGGDPAGNGTGGPGYKFADEQVTRKYDEGIVAMANAGPNTNGSQFFIMLADRPELPPNYTIFGKVTKGQDVVAKIKVGDVMQTVEIVDLGKTASPKPSPSSSVVPSPTQASQ